MDEHRAPRRFPQVRWGWVVPAAAVFAVLSPFLIVYELFVLVLLGVWTAWMPSRARRVVNLLVALGLGVVPYFVMGILGWVFR